MQRKRGARRVGRRARRGGRPRVVARLRGRRTHAPRGVRDWHGAVADTELTHVSITFPNEDAEHLTIEWLEPVTDEVYGSAAGQ